MKIKSFLTITVAALTCAAVAEDASVLPPVPVVSDVAYRQSAGRRVDITYRLGGTSAVITVDVLTNGVSVGGKALATMAGDVNRLVTADDNLKHVTWNPRATMPNVKFSNGEVTVKVKAWDSGEMPPYLVVDIRPDSAPDNRIAFYASADEIPGGVGADFYKTESVILKLVPAAGNSFVMGSPEDEEGRVDARERQHTVTFTRDFYMGIYQVSAHQHQLATMGYSDLSSRPEKDVSYNNLRGAAPTISWPTSGHKVADNSVLAAWRNRTGVEFDLPTSAQWEYVCRAGSNTIFFWGTDASKISTYGWSNEDGSNRIGTHTPNGWGFYEMASNPWSWCLDWTGSTEGMSSVDPTGPQSANTSDQSRRVGRGSGSNAANARSAKVNPQDPSSAKYGYRLICPVTLVW